MNRRNLLAALPVALAVGAVPAAAGRETAVLRAYREFIAHHDWIAVTPLDDDELDAATDYSDALLKRIVDAAPEDAADTVIKFLAVTQDYEALYGCPYKDALYAEVRTLLPITQGANEELGT